MPETKHGISDAPYASSDDFCRIDFRRKRNVNGETVNVPWRRIELITTITKVTRILVLALLFVAVVDFSLDSARYDLVVMTAALSIILSGGLRSP